MVATIQLYSCLAIERLTGVNRHTVRGLISGLKLPVYAGPRGSIAIDEAGLKVLIQHIRDSSISSSEIHVTGPAGESK